MNNLSSYCGLVDSKIRASDKDLPVQGQEGFQQGHSIASMEKFHILLYPNYLVWQNKLINVVTFMQIHL